MFHYFGNDTNDSALCVHFGPVASNINNGSVTPLKRGYWKCIWFEIKTLAPRFLIPLSSGFTISPSFRLRRLCLPARLVFWFGYINFSSIDTDSSPKPLPHLARRVLATFPRDPLQTIRDPRNLYLFHIFQCIVIYPLTLRDPKTENTEILFNLFSLGLLAKPQAWRGSAGCFVENQN